MGREDSEEDSSDLDSQASSLDAAQARAGDAGRTAGLPAAAPGGAWTAAALPPLASPGPPPRPPRRAPHAHEGNLGVALAVRDTRKREDESDDDSAGSTDTVELDQEQVFAASFFSPTLPPTPGRTPLMTCPPPTRKIARRRCWLGTDRAGTRRGRRAPPPSRAIPAAVSLRTQVPLSVFCSAKMNRWYLVQRPASNPCFNPEIRR